MRYREFLLEYNRDITKKNFGEKLLAALQKERPKDDNWNLLNDPVQKQQLIDDFIKQLEDADPTPHKEYVQWMARKFTDPKNLVQFEDYLGQLPMYLKKFHKLKQRRMLENPRNDINKYENVPDFMNVMDEYPDPDTTQAASNRGSATTYYEDKDLRIIEPRDQQAACYYGQGTRWCTAATVGKNYFLRYHEKGPLYIMIPKQPKYNGEKYQFHFSTNSFMDEKDQSILKKGKEKELVERYPQLGEIFSEQIRQYHNGYWMTNGLTEKDRKNLIKSFKKDTVDMPDGSHVMYLNDDTEVEYLDIVKENKARVLLTNGQEKADDYDPDDTDLSRGGDGLPLLAFAIFNKDYTDGIFVTLDVNTGKLNYKSPKNDRPDQGMPDDIKPVYDELSKIVTDYSLDNIQTFLKIQKIFVPLNSRMSMFDIREYLSMYDDN